MVSMLQQILWSVNCNRLYCCLDPPPFFPKWRLQITHLFKDVLHGNGRFAMVVNVSPAAEEFNETKRVLQVGAAGWMFVGGVGGGWSVWLDHRCEGEHARHLCS